MSRRRSARSPSPSPVVVVLLLVLGLSAVAAVGSRAQESAGPAASPHGDLDRPCLDCHSTEAWRPLAKPRAFAHEETGFPLIAAHRQVGCLDCHRDLRFAYVPTACLDCHDDPHRAALGLDCASCHTPHGWERARQDMRALHAGTLFPLTGAHASLDCESCHVGPPPFEHRVVPTDCFACHAADYHAARDPDHVQAGFPTTCETCHGTVDFSGADFRGHDAFFFPIFSGPHAGVWSACSDCHTSSTSFAQFDCLSCHPRGEMRDEHDDVGGYAYSSPACFDCHPDGRD